MIKRWLSVFVNRKQVTKSCFSFHLIELTVKKYRSIVGLCVSQIKKEKIYTQY